MSQRTPHDSNGFSVTQFEWFDLDRQPWTIELAPTFIALRGLDRSIQLPKEAWSRDLYVLPHGGSLLIRVETFDVAARFLVPAEEARPLVEHLKAAHVTAGGAEIPREAPTPVGPLLWPKVSPLAVWALILSSLAFLPIFGWIPAAGTLILLTLHRAKVRRAVAWNHSRRLCVAAFLVLAVGSVVNVAATRQVDRPLARPHPVLGHSTSPRSGLDPTIIVCGLAVLVLSLTVHEAAHAITAWWLGDGLARSMGRVTLNPIAHIDPFGTLLLPALLAWTGGPVFGYARPVPVQVELLPRRHRAHVLIALAGPGSNLLMAAASLMLLVGVGTVLRMSQLDASVSHFLSLDVFQPVRANGFVAANVAAIGCTFLKLSFVVNTILAMFNLIPIPPLDGSWVLEHLFPRTLGRGYALLRPYGIIVFVLAASTNAFHYLMLPVQAVLLPGFVLLHRVMGV